MRSMVEGHYSGLVRPMTASNLIMIGAVMGAFGVRGELKVKTFTAEARDVASYGPLLNKDGAVVITPRRARVLKDSVAIGGPEVTDRDIAESLRGTQLFVPREKLPAPSEDEFYHVDLIGLAAEDLSGAPLGQITDVQNFGAGDLLEVSAPKGSGLGAWFLPFTKENAPRIDFAEGRIVIDPPPGLGPNALPDDDDELRRSE